MKIVLAQMPPNPRDTPPYDVALTSAILKKEGHEVVVLDVNNDMYHQVYKQRPYWKFRIASHLDEPSETLFLQKQNLFEEAADRILSHKPDAIVFRTENGSINAKNTAEVLMRRAPDVPRLASGTISPDRNLINTFINLGCYDAAERPDGLPYDYHIIGEDDLALPKVLDGIAGGKSEEELGRELSMKNGVVDSRNGPLVENLDSLPFYDFTPFEFGRYADPEVMRINISRSCVKRCAFCVDYIMVRKFRCMSGDRWFEEYEHQLALHPQIRHMRHYDRLLNGDVPALNRFCERMIAKYPTPRVQWGGDCIITHEMTPELLEKMARAGCNNIGVGFETGSARVRESMNKNFFSNEFASEFLKQCARHNITTDVNILVGFPTESLEDFAETLGFIENNKKNITRIRITLPTVNVAPGSLLFHAPHQYELADTHVDKWVSVDGSNTYAERVRRFKVLCEKVLDENVGLAVNRRLVKTRAAIRQLLKELGTEPREAAPMLNQ